MILAITGKIGTGKTTLAHNIQERGFFELEGEIVPFKNASICEVDHVGHQLLDLPEVKELVVKVFGTGILEGERISRKKLGDIVFADETKMKNLTDIVHPRITDICRKIMEQARVSGANLIIAVALPKSLNLLSVCDYVLQLEQDKEETWHRVHKRNPDMTREKFDTIWLWQDAEYGL